jgi:GTPase SAR1 family protein
MTEIDKLQREIHRKTLARLGPLFSRYRMDLDSLEAALKWKPIVLILGNFSSGKSTLINEFLGAEIQRTGQAPTDDSFTVLTGPEPDRPAAEIPGATLVTDERLPFTPLKKYGEQFAAHFRLRQVDSPLLRNLAIIDSPGMLDAVTEKDRGYDYGAVIGELARLADLVILMFDPHKAGTVREVYDTIRLTLPENAGEDRILFVMSRIDECDNPADLVRSYGTLCWNLSQMTGRKDIPRIFLTYSPMTVHNPEIVAAWHNERDELKERVFNAPALRISHLLQHVDKQARELSLVAETMTAFGRQGRRLLARTRLFALLAAAVFFFLGDLSLRQFTGHPESTLLGALFQGRLSVSELFIPLTGALTILTAAWIFFLKYQLPRLRARLLADPETLLDLGTEYRRQLWRKIRPTILLNLGRAGAGDLLFTHRKNLEKIKRFLNRDLQDYYKKTP